MNRRIRRLIISIVIAISVVLVSIPIWSIANGNRIGILANSYGELKISTRVGAFESLLVVGDEKAFEIINPTTISFKNRNGYKKDFDLYLLIDKKSTVPYEYIRVSINDTIYSLSELEVESDEYNYYFKLESRSLDAYKDEDVNARIWINNNSEGLTSESSLITNFITK